MEKKNQLTEAVIAYGMKSYAEEQGEKILEEVEKINAIEGIPEEKELKEFMKVYEKEKKRKKRNKKEIFYRFTMVAAVLLLLFNISIFTVPALKDTAINFVAVKQDKYTIIKSKNDVQETSKIERSEVFDDACTMTYVPKGYKQTQLAIDLCGVIEEYMNEEGTSFVAFSQDIETAGINIDTENAETEYIDILGEKALVASKEKQISIIWKKGKYFYSVASLGISKEEAIKCANSIQKNKKLKY